MLPRGNALGRTVTSRQHCARYAACKLSLYYCLCDGIDDIAASDAGGPWDATTLTWNNQPTGPVATPVLDIVNLNPNFPIDFSCGDLDTFVAVDGTAASKAGWYVTSLEQSWSDGNPNNGIVLEAVPEGAMAGGSMGAYFGHTEIGQCGEQPPRLVVEYQ